MGDALSLKFYNTLTREKAVFEPIDPQNVRMYVCGPTVYDFAHIGNARPVIVFDVLNRLLRHVYGEKHVTYVRNITDVDDKINARALRDFPGLPLNDAIRNVTEKTEKQFLDDAAALGCLAPDFQPRATDNIVQMIDIIQKLLDRGNAYVTAGSEGREVLFSVPSMPDYGQLSKRKLEDQQAGARIAVEAHKRNSGDFVLWKESEPSQPGWHAEFVSDGEKTAIFGRPGWHIECSAMSQRYLGDTFDIHGGGLDLIFPHHENEIAQSRCANDTSVMANVWMHNGFLQVEGKKMSKSEGNFVTIAELLHTDKFGGRKWPGEVLRLAMLMTHYREPIDFSVKRLEEAQNLSLSYGNVIRTYGADPTLVMPEVLDALADDLNTPLAIQAIQKRRAPPENIAATIYFLGLENIRMAAIGEKVREEQRAGIRESVERAHQAYDLRENLERAHQTYDLQERGYSEDSLRELIEARKAHTAAKDWALADKIRDELLARGIQLRDGKDPATGERVTTWEVKR